MESPFAISATTMLNELVQRLQFCSCKTLFNAQRCGNPARDFLLRRSMFTQPKNLSNNLVGFFMLDPTLKHLLLQTRRFIILPKRELFCHCERRCQVFLTLEATLHSREQVNLFLFFLVVEPNVVVQDR
ncbi:hypothetical protein PsorP6_002933 [Peronosclerospora sorghi]|uniref:Uncharacterized protein n=1 Tax=Peronosclerospora sorghi TaxID=230839 RepID=A0ACC0VIQ7_9STRA|nr:hypothetical protein PsorP6_002933 [Peronosclerospora sorghi]